WVYASTRPTGFLRSAVLRKSYTNRNTNRSSGSPSADRVMPDGGDGTMIGSGNLRTGFGATAATDSSTKSLATQTSSTSGKASAIDSGKSSSSQNHTPTVRRSAKNSGPS